ncbi:MULTISPECIES: hypothetical protein [Lysobacter]|uniref:Uncharacterized protein n=1 Tax=Lysobacter auxotrophicus TaxID=2992573 RepID=A0ABM8DG24_9GAMM|nr:hypothetical protein [Lysobacter auxotrophicus]BDU17547.1 hypothetical protein LA521A_27480 [Lysobacter auxotrophicus]
MRREREMLARGTMTADEEREFEISKAFEMHRAELRRNPEAIAPELPLQRAA